MAAQKKAKSQYTDEELQGMKASELEKLLQEKQVVFVREYLIDRNGTQAAIRAGYKAGNNNRTATTTASRLLKDPVITAYRLALQKEAFRSLGISLETVCADLVEIKDRCMQKVEVMEWNTNTHRYEPTGEWAFDAKGATRALVELAGLLGLKETAKNKESGVRIVFEEGAEAYAK